jgi:hypothetical protein
MMADSTVGVAMFLLALGVTSLVLAYMAGRFSVRSSGRRAGALALLGVSALAVMVYVLWDRSWSTLWVDMLWPALVYLAAAGAGLGIGVSLVYGLVAAR